MQLLEITRTRTRLLWGFY
uniref:Uncharacterized protein n=1 Tax=Rhizophora mucronata TaxID=61149 RepID=A0A2P2QIY1_RHIMU